MCVCVFKSISTIYLHQNPLDFGSLLQPVVAVELVVEEAGFEEVATGQSAAGWFADLQFSARNSAAKSRIHKVTCCDRQEWLSVEGEQVLARKRPSLANPHHAVLCREDY